MIGPGRPGAEADVVETGVEALGGVKEVLIVPSGLPGRSGNFGAEVLRPGCAVVKSIDDELGLFAWPRLMLDCRRVDATVAAVVAAFCSGGDDVNDVPDR